MKGKSINNLLELRTSKNLLQREIAESSNISREYYTQIEAGERTPSLTVANQLAKTFGITLDEFFLLINVTK